jgi:hypothetical protein
MTASVVKWSEFLATDPEVPGLERGPLSLVRITEELFQRNCCSGIEDRN